MTHSGTHAASRRESAAPAHSSIARRFWQAGQRIRTSRFLQAAGFRFDVTLQANDSPSHSYARAELARIEWLS